MSVRGFFTETTAVSPAFLLKSIFDSKKSTHAFAGSYSMTEVFKVTKINVFSGKQIQQNIYGCTLILIIDCQAEILKGKIIIIMLKRGFYNLLN